MSANAAKCWSRELAPTSEFTWKSKAPMQCRFFICLALRNRCWTSDRLSHRGFDHQEACPLFDQGEETINHLLLTCVFTRQIWMIVCQAMGKRDWIPSPTNIIQRSGGARTVACRESQALAEDLNVHNLLVASDCEVIVNYNKQGTGDPHPAMSLKY